MMFEWTSRSSRIAQQCCFWYVRISSQSKDRSKIFVCSNYSILAEHLQESSLPQVFPNKSLGNLGMVTRSRANGRSCGVEDCRKSPQPASPVIHRASPYKKDNIRKVNQFVMLPYLHFTMWRGRWDHLITEEFLWRFRWWREQRRHWAVLVEPRLSTPFLDTRGVCWDEEHGGGRWSFNTN